MQTLAGLTLDISRKQGLTPGNHPLGDDTSIQTVLNTFALLNVLQLLGIFGLFILQRRQTALQHRRSQCFAPDSRRSTLVLPKESVDFGRREASLSINGPYGSTSSSNEHDVLESPEIPLSASEELHRPLLGSRQASYSPPESVNPPPLSTYAARNAAEERRGRIFVRACGTLVVLTWMLFLGTAWVKLRARAER